MYVSVSLLSGYQKPLWYTVPASLQQQVEHGSLVRVPLRSKTYIGLVTHISFRAPGAFAIRDITALEHMPDDGSYQAFIAQVCQYYQIPTTYIYKRLRHFLKKRPRPVAITQSESTATATVSTLTPEQQHAVDHITPAIDAVAQHNGAFAPSVLLGVTGSGKTEVYCALIKHCIAQQLSTLLMLPEVTLAIHFAHRLRTALPDIEIYPFHSASSAQDKYSLWQALLQQKPILIIGVHMPVLLPINKLGLIIIDEEHDPGYQEKKFPALHTKELALLRAQHAKIPIVLGSATPSITTLHRAHQRQWPIYTLTTRYRGAFPHIDVVVLTEQKKRPHFWISTPLHAAIKKQLADNKQTLLFLNRRGYAFFVQCSRCGFIVRCTQCSVSMTLHEQEYVSCHYCGITHHIPDTCPGCHAPQKSFIKKGIGTQQLASIIQELFPTARIARADLDTTKKKGVWHDIIQRMHNREIDILIGTQTITKGLDFKEVTLVGIIWADLHLHMPTYTASERTIQQLLQVAGRAGRHEADSSVIVQTMQDHTVFHYLHEKQYLDFYAQELQQRTQLHYPPDQRLACIELTHTDHDTVKKEAQTLAQTLRTFAPTRVQILGPALPPVFKIKHQIRYTLYIKSPYIQDFITLWQLIDQSLYTSSITYTPNPKS